MAKGLSLVKGIAAGIGAAGAIAAIGAGSLLAAKQRVRQSCKPFYESSQKRLVIPGLKDGFVPQDLFYVKSADLWLFSGYDSGLGNKKVSPIYKVDSEGNASRLLLELPNGITYKGHGAAICATDELAFVTVKDGYVVMDLSKIIEASNGDTIQAFAHVPVELEPAFMNIQDGVLYIGEFYHNFFYNTPKSHWQTCPNGDTNPALMYAYDASTAAGSLFGFTPRPSRVYSIPGDVQGMCIVSDNRIVLSKSWGFGDAEMLVYKPNTAIKKGTNAEGVPSYLVAGEEAPLYYLDKDNLEKTIKVPPMAEGIESVDGEVWLANESASNLYLLGKLNDGKYVYSLSV